MSQLRNEAFGKVKDRPAMLATALALGVLLFLPAIHGFWQGAKVEAQVVPQKEEVDQAESLLSGLQASTKKVQERMTNLESALRLEQERLRWPLLLEEVAKRSQPGMWITKLAVLDEATPRVASANPPKPDGRNVPPLLVEISGIFETKSEEADAQVVDKFCRSLEQGGILKKVVTVERETPQRSDDGKTEQVALRFTIRGEWAQGARDEQSRGPAKKT